MTIDCSQQKEVLGIFGFRELTVEPVGMKDKLFFTLKKFKRMTHKSPNINYFERLNSPLAFMSYRVCYLHVNKERKQSPEG